MISQKALKQNFYFKIYCKHNKNLKFINKNSLF